MATRPAEESAVEALRHALLSQVAVVEVDREVSGDWYQTVAENPDLLAKALAMSSAHRRAVTDLLALRLGVDVAQLDLRPGAVTATMFAAADQASRAWLDGGAEGSLPEITEQALAFLEGGLRYLDPPPRRRSPAARVAEDRNSASALLLKLLLCGPKECSYDNHRAADDLYVEPLAA